ncbi:CRISPR-associated helicase Cas3' [Nocardia sp. NPDC050435]|uniref:CRISPR-associated helicase Cas3' n=1 Tax=Nocardia sp. NPDC050435 TaxID=3155040 RepID=UPI0033D7B7C4
MLSDATLSAWAKSDKDGGSLSLVRHLADSAAVASLVWDRWLPRHTKDAIAAGLPGEHADGRILLCWLAGIHDIGKLTPAFACQVRALAEVMHDKGLTWRHEPANRRSLPHGLAGQIELDRFLQLRGWRRKVAATYSIVVGSHHGVPPTPEEITRAPHLSSLLGTGQWARSREELLAEMTTVTGAEPRLGQWQQVSLSLTQQALLTAAVIVSDWLASNQDLFALDSARDSEPAAAAVWEQLGLPAPWAPRPQPEAELFQSRFELPAGARIRPLQVACMDLAARMPEAGLMIVEAPMGEGKTEAALAAAEILVRRFELGGVFMALPTMATSDAMFARVNRWVQRLPDTPGSMFLAHGKAALNPDFAELKRRGFAGIGLDCGDSAIAAHSWLVGKKGPLANIVVGTIDQILRAALKSRHVMLRHLALANKVVVIDEVHAADMYMSTYLCRCLEWLGAYRIPVLLLSATLPPAQRDSLLSAYQRGRLGGGLADPLEAGGGYPCVTVWPPVEANPVIEASGRSLAVQIIQISDDLATLVETVRTELADGGVAGIVCNTVGRAQETFSALLAAQVVEPDDILLVHSRFLAAHRSELEQRLRALLGPPADARDPRPVCRFVLVGTQVIEQTLDIDLDLLISDLAPVDLLLQRIGRLHRHARAVRPDRLSRPRCLVRGMDWRAAPPVPVSGSVAVYGESRLLRAAAVLFSTSETVVNVPADIPGLVEGAYAEVVDVPAAWSDAFGAAEQRWRQFLHDQRDRAQAYLLASPISEIGTLRGWLAASPPDDIDTVGGQAQVRDAEDTIEAIVVQRIGEQIHVLPEIPDFGGRPIPTATEPSARLAKVLAGCTIRLPASLTRYGRMKKVIDALEDNFYSGWQKSYWLAGELVLELDEQYSAEVADQVLQYDTVLGLTVESRKGAQRARRPA